MTPGLTHLLGKGRGLISDSSLADREEHGEGTRVTYNTAVRAQTAETSDTPPPFFFFFLLFCYMFSIWVLTMLQYKVSNTCIFFFYSLNTIESYGNKHERTILPSTHQQRSSWSQSSARRTPIGCEIWCLILTWWELNIYLLTSFFPSPSRP